MRGMLPEVLKELEGVAIEVALAPSGLPCLRLTGVVGEEWRKRLLNAFPLLSITQQHELDFLFTKWFSAETLYARTDKLSAGNRSKAETTSRKTRKRA
jgi:hypothetical protein